MGCACCVRLFLRPHFGVAVAGSLPACLALPIIVLLPLPQHLPCLPLIVPVSGPAIVDLTDPAPFYFPPPPAPFCCLPRVCVPVCMPSPTLLLFIVHASLVIFLAALPSPAHLQLLYHTLVCYCLPFVGACTPSPPPAYYLACI